MEIICPFCPLRCREIPVQAEADAGTREDVGAGSVTGRGLSESLGQNLGQFCSLLTERLAAANRAEDGLPFSDTLSAFRGWLSSNSSWRPRISIEGTFLDVQTARAAIRLAASLNGRIDAATGHGEMCVQEVLEREGYIGATLGDVAERADSVLLLGPVEQRLPRLSRFWSESIEAGRIFRVADADSTLDKDAISKLLIDAHNQLLHRFTGSGNNDSATTFANWLEQTSYLAVMWTSEVLDLVSASALVRLVQLLNERQRRAVLVPISETVTFRTTAAWLTGFGGPIQFRSGLPEIVERSNLIGSGDFIGPSEWMVPDVRIWLHPFADSLLPPTNGAPSDSAPSDGAKLVVIGAGDRELVQRADFYFRTTMPGVEAAGTTFRGDGTVALPLTDWRRREFPHASQILQELAAIW